MGNCLRHHHAESSTQWGDDDCGSPTSIADKGLAGHGRVFTSSSPAATTTASTKPSTTTEVKIKITRKQLEELLGIVDVKELSVHQVLAQLMNVSDRYETQQRSWRPALQSIPE